MHKKWIYNRFAMYTNPATVHGRTSGDNESSSLCPLCSNDLSGTAADVAGAMLALTDEAIAMDREATAAHGAGAGSALTRIRLTSPRISTPYKHLVRQRPRTGLARLEPIVQTYQLPPSQPAAPRNILQPSSSSAAAATTHGNDNGQGQLRVRIVAPDTHPVAGSLSLESGKLAPFSSDRPDDGSSSVDEHKGDGAGTKPSTPYVAATTHEPLSPGVPQA
jgi:hypothetical protein